MASPLSELRRSPAVRRRLGRLVEALLEEACDRLGADHRSAVLEDDGRDRLGTRCSPEHVARLAGDGHLPDHVVDAELGQTLANAVRGRAPLGLVQLEHHARTWPTTRRSASARFSRLPQTVSQSSKTPASATE
jgi:hypothetical protein